MSEATAPASAPAASAPASSPAAETAPASAPGGAPAPAGAAPAASPAAGASAGEAPPATPAEGAPAGEQPKAESKESESERITRWAERQRAAEAREEKLKAERSALEGERAGHKAAVELAARIEAAKGKPAEVARLLTEVLGTSYEDLTKVVVEQTTDPKVAELEKQIEAVKKSEQQRQQLESQRQQVYFQQLQHTEVVKMLEGGGEKYELTRLYEQPSTIYEMAEAIVATNPKRAPRDAEGVRKLYAEVADALEKQHEGRLEKLLGTGKVKARLAPKPPAAALAAPGKPAAAPAPTLTNGDSSRSTEVKPRKETSDQRFARIIREHAEKAKASGGGSGAPK